jgi:hypothetical protein
MTAGLPVTQQVSQPAVLQRYPSLFLLSQGACRNQDCLRYEESNGLFEVRLPEGLAAGIDRAGSPFSDDEPANDVAELQFVHNEPRDNESFSMSTVITRCIHLNDDSSYGRFTIIIDASGA